MLADFLELNKLEKEQLIQLCEALYTLIKDLAMGKFPLSALEGRASGLAQGIHLSRV